MKHSTDKQRKSLIRKFFSAALIPAILIVGGVNITLTAQNHLLLSEITLQIAAAEFIEIYNPTNSTINLDDYYLADNQSYPYLPGGNLPAMDVGDFVVRFPQGALINSNETVVVATNGADFEVNYAKKADFEIQSADVGTPDMINIDQLSPGLSNVGEGIALFHWNGSDNIVQDVDLMNAGIPNVSSQIVDKSSIPGYLPDAHTMPLQDQSGPPGDGFSTKRIMLEGQHEIHAGGNGITGDDETSEDISVTWDEAYTIPNPGSTDLTPFGIGSDKDSGSSMRLYPNPSSSLVNLKVNTHANHFTIQISNSMGAVLETTSYSNAGDQLIQINLSKFESGIYFISFQSDIEISIQKVVLSK